MSSVCGLFLHFTIAPVLRTCMHRLQHLLDNIVAGIRFFRLLRLLRALSLFSRLLAYDSNKVHRTIDKPNRVQNPPMRHVAIKINIERTISVNLKGHIVVPAFVVCATKWKANTGQCTNDRIRKIVFVSLRAFSVWNWSMIARRKVLNLLCKRETVRRVQEKTVLYLHSMLFINIRFHNVLAALRKCAL